MELIAPSQVNQGESRASGFRSAAGVTSLADDLNIPPWRYQPNTTYQIWEFDEAPDFSDVIPPDDYFGPDNDPYMPYLDFPGSASGPTWYSEYDGRDGVCSTPADGDYNWVTLWLENYIPENPDRWKEIYIQVVWHWDEALCDVDLFYPYGDYPAELLVSEFMGPGTYPEGWFYEQWRIVIDDHNPIEESIDLWGCPGYPLIIDQIVVDTRCIPEPASLSLLALGGLALLRCKR